MAMEIRNPSRTQPATLFHHQSNCHPDRLHLTLGVPIAISQKKGVGHRVYREYSERLREAIEGTEVAMGEAISLETETGVRLTLEQRLLAGIKK